MKKRLIIALFALLACTQAASAMQERQMRPIDKQLYEAARDGKLDAVIRLMSLRYPANPYAKNYDTSDTAASRVKSLAAKESGNGTYHQIYAAMTGETLPVRQRQIRVIPGFQLNRPLNFDEEEE